MQFVFESFLKKFDKMITIVENTQIHLTIYKSDSQKECNLKAIDLLERNKKSIDLRLTDLKLT